MHKLFETSDEFEGSADADRGLFFLCTICKKLIIVTCELNFGTCIRKLFETAHRVKQKSLIFFLFNFPI